MIPPTDFIHKRIDKQLVIDKNPLVLGGPLVRSHASFEILNLNLEIKV